MITSVDIQYEIGEEVQDRFCDLIGYVDVIQFSNREMTDIIYGVVWSNGEKQQCASHEIRKSNRIAIGFR